MNGYRLSHGIVSIAVLTLATAGALSLPVEGTADPVWQIKADIAESCSCDPACPCMFGSPMTNDTCEGSRLYEIDEASYGDTDLDGLKVVAIFRVGSWVKYVVSENATDEQIEALPSLIAAVSPVFDVEVKSLERGRIDVEREEQRVKFTTSSSVVEIAMMEGKGGQPIAIQHLPYEDLTDYIQYKSVENSHNSEAVSFKYSGTNGFTSRVDTSG